MGGDRPVSRWLLTPCKSVLLHRRRELVPGSDVSGRAGGVGRRWSGCGRVWSGGLFLVPICQSAVQALSYGERYSP